MSPGNDQVERSEYENFVRTYEVRHAELLTEIKEVEVDTRGQINNLNKKLDDLSTQMSNLSVQVSRRSLDIWKLASTTAVGIIVGYIGGLLQHLLLR